MKQIYKITYPTGKFYIGKDSVGSSRYFGSPDIGLVNADFALLPEDLRQNYSVQKQILWQSEDCSEAELSTKEVEFISQYRSNDPSIGYNRWPKFKQLFSTASLGKGTWLFENANLCEEASNIPSIDDRNPFSKTVRVLS